MPFKDLDDIGTTLDGGKAVIGNNEDVGLFQNFFFLQRLEDFRQIFVAVFDAGQRIARANPGFVLRFVRVTEPEQGVFRNPFLPKRAHQGMGGPLVLNGVGVRDVRGPRLVVVHFRQTFSQ